MGCVPIQREYNQVMPKKSRDELWIIEFQSPDPSLCFTNAYHNKKEAVERAIGWIKNIANLELDQFEWTDQIAPDMLREILEAIKNKDYDDAIVQWLDFQEEYDPDEQIALGPSGFVSPRSMDYLHHGDMKPKPKDFPDEPGYRGCSIHANDVEECKADPEACRWTCDVHDQGCRTPTCRHYADTKSFMCDEARKQFLRDYRWDEAIGDWVERDL